MCNVKTSAFAQRLFEHNIANSSCVLQLLDFGQRLAPPKPLIRHVLMPQAAASGARFPPTARDRAKMSAREQLEHDEELLALRMQRRLRFNRASGPGGLQHLLRRTLKLFDKSDTGDLDYAEFRAALAYFGCDGVPDAALDALVRHFDADGSGAVNVDEFIARAEAIMFHRAPRARGGGGGGLAEPAPPRADAVDHIEELLLAKLRARVRGDTRRELRAALLRRLRRHDADASGALDRDELLAALEEFVPAIVATSDATLDALVARYGDADGRVAVARFADALSGRDADERAARVVPHAEMVDGGGTSLDAWQRTANRQAVAGVPGPVMKGEMFEVQ